MPEWRRPLQEAPPAAEWKGSRLLQALLLNPCSSPIRNCSEAEAGLPNRPASSAWIGHTTSTLAGSRSGSARTRCSKGSGDAWNDLPVFVFGKGAEGFHANAAFRCKRKADAGVCRVVGSLN